MIFLFRLCFSIVIQNAIVLAFSSVIREKASLFAILIICFGVNYVIFFHYPNAVRRDIERQKEDQNG